MCFKKLHLLVCLGLLAVITVMAGKEKESGPMTLEQADRAQDLYLDGIQNRIVAVSDKPSKAGFSDLWHISVMPSDRIIHPSLQGSRITKQTARLR